MANFNLPAIPVTPLGPLSGVYRGTQYNYGVADLERQFRDSDLTNQRMQNLYQNELLDNPMKEAERGSKIATAGYEQDLINSGAKKDQYLATTDSTKAGTEGQKLLNQKNEIVMASDALTRAAAMPEMALIGNWEQLGDQAKKLNIKWPEGGATVENRVKLKQMADASRMTVARLNELEMKQIDHANTMAVHSFDKEANYKQAMDTAKIHAQSARDAASINASALRQQAIDRDVYQKALIEVSKDGTLSYDTALALGEATLKAEGISMKDLRADAKTQVMREQNSKDKQLSPEAQAARVDKIASDQWEAMAVTRGLNLSKGKLPAKDLNKLSPQVAESLKKSGKVVSTKEDPQATGTPAPAASTKVVSVTPQKAEALISRFMADNKVSREIAIQELSKVADMSSVSAAVSPKVSELPKRTTVEDLNKQIVSSAVSSVTPETPVGSLNKRILNTLTGQ